MASGVRARIHACVRVCKHGWFFFHPIGPEHVPGHGACSLRVGQDLGIWEGLGTRMKPGSASQVCTVGWGHKIV